MTSHVETVAGQAGPGEPGGPGGSGGESPPTKSAARRAAPWVGLLAVAITAIVGSNAFGVRDTVFGTATPKAAAPATGRSASGATQDTTASSVPLQATSLRSQPWWQDVTTLDGTGSSTPAAFTIADSAIQWRVKWTCQTGHIVVKASNQAKPVLDANCPSGTEGYGSRTGNVSLQVTADGPWHLQVAQQIDAPLVEPPSPAMTAPGASPLSSGTFYNIDKVGQGKATVYKQADGKYAIRLDDFFVSPNADLELRFSPLAAPHSSKEVQDAGGDLVVIMDVTAGSFNYAVPAGVDVSKYKSLVVWCAPISSAYAAASLK